MRKVFIGLLLVVALAAFSQNEWHWGYVHMHTKKTKTIEGSDGTQTIAESIAQAQKNGASFIFFNNHFEQIVDQDKYWRQFASPKNLCVFGGYEIATFWPGGASHLLAIGDIAPDPKLNEFSMQHGKLQELIDHLNGKNIITVAAHPSFLIEFSASITPVYPTNFRFDKENANGVKGIEFFNETPVNDSETFEWYLKKSQTDDVFVTAGADSHSKSTGWDRKTFLFLRGEYSKKAVYDAFRAGETYAARYGITPRFFKYRPQFAYHKVTRPEFDIKFEANKNISTTKKVGVYRDGELINESIKEMKRGTDFLHYTWIDEQATVGKHTYIVRMFDSTTVVISSPIRLDVRYERVGTKNFSKDYYVGMYMAKYVDDTRLEGSENEFKTLLKPPFTTNRFAANTKVAIYFEFQNKENLIFCHGDKAIGGYWDTYDPQGEKMGNKGTGSHFFTPYFFTRIIRCDKYTYTKKGTYTIYLSTAEGEIMDSQQFVIY